jgi:hypothetical protein
VSPEPELSPRRILALWWPLAASWLLMGVELPLFTACVARMRDPEVNLAAYGSLVFPIALVIEAPIMMLLSAAGARGDLDSWGRVRRFMHKTSACLTALHVAVAFTPLFDWLALRVFGDPEAVIEPARLGLRIMTPWTWSIAYRRTHQGVLIRFERSRPVMIGTCVRLAANATVYCIGFALPHFGIEPPGIAVGASAVACGVLSEATFIGWCTRAVLAERPLPPGPGSTVLTRGAFLRFYVPLALTPLIALVTQPIGAAAMARMREPLLSLAAWPGLHGLLFLARTGGFAFNEVVLSLLGVPGAVRCCGASGCCSARSSAIPAPCSRRRLATAGSMAPWACRTTSATWRPVPSLGALWPSRRRAELVQGSLTAAGAPGHRAMVAFFATVAALLFAGVRAWSGSGASCAVLALTLGSIAQTAWLGWRYRGLAKGSAGSPSSSLARIP